jgi:hypothetical protein
MGKFMGVARAAGLFANVGAILFLSSLMSSAATVTLSGGNLIGATGVSVGGVSYDVSFLDGTCVSIFNGCDSASDFMFQTAESALLASSALMNSVFVDGPLGSFDTSPWLVPVTAGIFAFGEAYTPFDVAPDGSFVRISSAFNDTFVDGSAFNGDRVFPAFDGSSSIFDTTGQPQFWAVWALSPTSVSPSVVPVPASALLLLSALGALVAVGRRLQAVVR